jgi:hypothetical protein
MFALTVGDIEGLKRASAEAPDVRDRRYRPAVRPLCAKVGPLDGKDSKDGKKNKP